MKMKQGHAFSVRFPVIFLISLYAASAFGWGKDGHAIINGSFTTHYPLNTAGFARFSQYYIDHASDADYRKSAVPSESPRHYIDIDYYPEFKSGLFPHDLDSLIAKYGSSTVYSNGVLPWAIKSDYDSLVIFFRQNDSVNANRVIADLGHYVGDAYQPLHCTRYYNRNGVHSRYETTMLRDYLSRISIEPDTALYISDPLDYAFGIISESNSRIQLIFDADDQAAGAAGNTSSDLYYQTMWSQLGSMTISQLQNASVSLASLVYSAWVDADRPPIFTNVEERAPLTFHINAPYPNPFNPTTNISVAVSKPFASPKGVVRIYSMNGSLLRTRVQRLRTGDNVVPLSFAGLASGPYIITVELNEKTNHEGRTFKALLLK